MMNPSLKDKLNQLLDLNLQEVELIKKQSELITQKYQLVKELYPEVYEAGLLETHLAINDEYLVYFDLWEASDFPDFKISKYQTLLKEDVNVETE